jgi:hypothetical protein
MLKIFSFIVGAFTCMTMGISADAPVCHHCEEIRLYNAEHHKNYEYFEDYLKTEGGDSANSVAEQSAPTKAKTVSEHPAPKL